MSPHPSHGTRPLARKLGLKVQHLDGGVRKHLWKLRATDNPRRILSEGGQVVKFVGTAEQAVEWASAYPGWEATHA